jgi:WD40 repeat protein
MLHNLLPVATGRCSWSKAFFQSLAAVLLCVLLVGFLYVPNELARLRAKPEVRAVTCALMPDGKSVVTLVESIGHERRDTIILRNNLSNESLAAPLVCPSPNPACLVVDPSGQRLFAGDAGGTIYSTFLERTNYLPASLGHVLKGSPLSMACTRNNKFLIVRDNFGLHAWNIDLGSHEHGNPNWYHVDRSISCFTLYPDSQSLVCGRTVAKYTELVECNIQSGQFRPTGEKVEGRLQKLVISPDGRFLAGVKAVGALALFQRRSTAEPWRPYSIPGLGMSHTLVACFSPRADLLITSDGECRRLCAWDLEQKQLRCDFAENPTTLLGCEFLNDNEILSWSMDSTLRVWNLQTQTPVRTMKL